MEPLKSLLSSTEQSNQLQIIIKGSRLEPKEYQYYPDYIFFNDDLITLHTQEEWKRVGLDSMPFYSIVKWDGKKIMPDKYIF